MCKATAILACQVLASYPSVITSVIQSMHTRVLPSVGTDHLLYSRKALLNIANTAAPFLKTDVYTGE